MPRRPAVTMAAIGQRSQPTRPRICAATSSGARSPLSTTKSATSDTSSRPVSAKAAPRYPSGRCRPDSGMRPARSTDRRAQPATNTPATRDRPERAGRRRPEASWPHTARWSTCRFPPTRTAPAPAPHREWGPCSDCGHQLIQIRGPLRDGGDRSAVVAAWRTWLVGPEPDRPELGCRPSRLASLTSPSNVSPDVSVTRNTTAPAMSRLVGSASPMNRQPPAT